MATRLNRFSAIALGAVLAVSSVAIPATAWATEPATDQVVSADSVSPPKVTVITTQPEAPLPYDYCGTDRDVFVPPADTAEYRYVKTVEGSTVYYTLAFNDGFEADGKIQTTWQYPFTNEPCPQEETLIEDEVLPPTFDDFCGAIDDGVNIPADGEHFSYMELRQIQDIEIVVDVYAVADEGWYFANDVMTAWSHVFKDDACPIVPPVVTPPVVVPPVVTPPVVPAAVIAPIVPASEQLAHTGVDTMAWMSLVLGLLGVGSIALLSQRVIGRRKTAFE